MTKVKTVGAVKRERATSYATWNLSTRLEPFVQKRIKKLNNRGKGGNTFICGKRKGRLDLEKCKS